MDRDHKQDHLTSRQSPHTRSHTRHGLVSYGCLGLLSAVLAVACVTDAKKQVDTSSALSAAEQKRLDEYRAEVELGRNMAGRLLAYYGSNQDETLLGYLNQVGNFVASYGDFPDRRYMVGVLKDEAVNAFACPGGYILVTEGALKSAANEAELASILGHEAAHVGLQHMFKTLQNMNTKDMEKHAKALEENQSLPYEVRVRSRPEPEETIAGATLARYLSGAGGAGFNVLRAAQAGMTLILEKGIDHKLELEADQEGVKYAVRAGYDPKALGAYLQRLENQQKASVNNLTKTHPPFKLRRKHLASTLSAMQAEDIIGARGIKRYHNMRQRIK